MKATVDTWVIGDIHGEYVALQSLLLRLPMDDNLVFLGDYIDRGPQSKDVIDLLLESATQRNCSFILGNHEEMMIHARQDKSMFKQWMYIGGLETMLSYGLPLKYEQMSEIPNTHWEFLHNCAEFIETDTHVFSHAPINPKTSLNEQTREDLRWNKKLPAKRPVFNKFNYFGHVAQASGQVLELPYATCVDTYAYGNGWLTALNIESKKIVQVNRTGDFNPLTV